MFSCCSGVYMFVVVVFLGKKPAVSSSFLAGLLFVVLFILTARTTISMMLVDTRRCCAAEPRQRGTRASGFVPLICPLTESLKDAMRRFRVCLISPRLCLPSFYSLSHTHTHKTGEKVNHFFFSLKTRRLNLTKECIDAVF